MGARECRRGVAREREGVERCVFVCDGDVCV